VLRDRRKDKTGGPRAATGSYAWAMKEEPESCDMKEVNDVIDEPRVCPLGVAGLGDGLTSTGSDAAGVHKALSLSSAKARKNGRRRGELMAGLPGAAAATTGANGTTNAGSTSVAKEPDAALRVVVVATTALNGEAGAAAAAALSSTVLAARGTLRGEATGEETTSWGSWMKRQRVP